jgi:AraC family transcriptional regulator, transcriptional activator of pobA
MLDDKLLLSEFRKAFRRNAKKAVVDLDDSFNHKFDFQVQRFEEVLKNTNRTIPPNRWSYYRIGLIREGEGEFLTGIYNFKAHRNTLIVIPNRVITSSKNWTLDTKGYVLLFNIHFFLQNNFTHRFIESKKILSHSIQPNIQLTENQADEIADIFETLIKEKQLKSNHMKELIALKILELLIISERLFEAERIFEESIPSIDIIKRFIDLLDINLLKMHAVRFYAEQLTVHPNYLNSLIKKHTGSTAKEAIQNRLLLETKYLLHSTNLTIKEISNHLGFNDPNYFTVFFKRFEKISPANYRSSFL